MIHTADSKTERLAYSGDTNKQSTTGTDMGVHIFNPNILEAEGSRKMPGLHSKLQNSQEYRETLAQNETIKEKKNST